MLGPLDGIDVEDIKVVDLCFSISLPKSTCMQYVSYIYGRLAYYHVLFLHDVWLVIVKGCVPGALGVWVCLLGTGSASCAENPSAIMWTGLRCRQTSVSPAVMLDHVGWCLLLGCLLLDLDGTHVQGQGQHTVKVLPVHTHTLKHCSALHCAGCVRRVALKAVILS